MDSNQQPHQSPADKTQALTPPPAASAPQETAEQRRTIRMQRGKAADVKITFMGSTNGADATESEGSSLDAVVHALGAIFHNTIHQSWLSVSDVNDTLDRALAIVQKALAEHDEITFSISD
ncbi:MAG: hypothetical protein JXN60_05225, partial [Lentisphaerae bacterium]|nr:hypothetical protein [Lentisphaerota bacterium]